MIKKQKKPIKKKWLWVPIIIISIWILFNFLAFSGALAMISETGTSSSLVAGVTLSLILGIYVSILAIIEMYRLTQTKVAKVDSSGTLWIKNYWKTSKFLTILLLWFFIELYYLNLGILKFIDILILWSVLHIKIHYPKK